MQLQHSYYIGVDVGTGSARACVIDHTGEIVGLASEDIALWHYGQVYYEQSTTDIWRCISLAVRRALAENKIDPSHVRGIGFDATCSLAAFSTDTDEPVSVTGPEFNNDRNVILWLDHRAGSETDKINATGHKVLSYVGGKMSIEMEIPKILWLKNNMPSEKFAKYKFYDLADALTHIATGSETRSLCSLVCKQGYLPNDPGSSVPGGWAEDFFETIGLGGFKENTFSTIGGKHGLNGQHLHAGELAGYLSEKAAKELGLPVGIPIGSGVIDAYAGWIGTVGAKVDLPNNPSDKRQELFTRLAAVAGTSTCHLVMSPNPVFVPGVWGPYRDVLLPDCWMAEGGQSATGQLLKHVIETHPAYNQAKDLADVQKTNIFAFLNEHLRDMADKNNAPCVAYLARHFFYYGDLWGNRSPMADPKMTGSIIGLTSDTSINSLAILYYSTLEFIALQTRQIIESMNRSGHHITSIFMSGSQCQNDILVNLIASACNMTVVVPFYVNAAVCHGAAMLGAKAATADAKGNTADLQEIMEKMSKPGKCFFPTADQREKSLLQAKYHVFLDQCQKQRGYRALVDQALAK
ncbi:FGGY family of carbohydrate kinases C-terminal domain protein [Aspergillus parasiticus SU-1]|uniref:FGGY family of carbohydrate kinases C-terminal domain protein n=1 Tax=Aspergillus parasiticus (strain ATCC 56775 / NRRL 5862 / SRRC 143 / SU-1) TaxID=1403190 RepID=A0A0F0ILV9_ASPPU|nr:FGGY family of carbohydrate kinases C-terminal domain protein [Aspergillus parasiticus SU-1]